MTVGPSVQVSRKLPTEAHLITLSAKAWKRKKNSFIKNMFYMFFISELNIDEETEESY